MVGGQPSEYCLKQFALFETGDISATEMRGRVIYHAQQTVDLMRLIAETRIVISKTDWESTFRALAAR
jgi:hypothetical protein